MCFGLFVNIMFREEIVSLYKKKIIIIIIVNSEAPFLCCTWPVNIIFFTFDLVESCPEAPLFVMLHSWANLMKFFPKF